MFYLSMAKGNILLLSKDILKCDYLSCYGGKKWKTKNIDELAKKGTIFKNHYTVAPSSAMSYTGMFSGLNPHELERKRFTEVEPFDQCPTLFDELSKKGYECHVLWDKRWSGNVFRLSRVYGDNTEIHNVTIDQPVGPHYFKSGKIKPKKGVDPVGELIAEVREIFENQESDIFLWIHCPHVLKGRTGYGSDIDLLDQLVGELRNFFSDDEIFITSDHGHMDLKKGIPVYGFHVYEPAIKIPLITPNFLDKDEVLNLTSNVQIKNMILNEEIDFRDFIYSDTQYYLQENRKLMVRKDDFKYIYNKIDNTEELYDLKYDPNEEVNLLIDHIPDKNRGKNYYLDEVHYYPRWREAEKYYRLLKNEKDRVWREGTWFQEIIYNKSRVVYENLFKRKFNFILKYFGRKKSKKEGRWTSKPKIRKYKT